MISSLDAEDFHRLYNKVMFMIVVCILILENQQV